MQQALALAHEDLACYAVAVWPQFSLANHHELIVSRLEAVERGEISRLMIFLPPRHGKSLLASTIFSAWYLGRHSERHGFSFLRPFNCRSPHQANDPGHGPYYRLTRKVEGKTVTETFSTDVALRKAQREVAEYHRFRRLSQELLEVNEQICRLRVTSLPGSKPFLVMAKSFKSKLTPFEKET
jgi:hypothetical protein